MLVGPAPTSVLDPPGSQQQDDQPRLPQETSGIAEQVKALTLELASANQRTENMESMAQSIREENRQLGQLIDQLQDNLGLTIAEKNRQIQDIQTGYRVIEYPTDILFQSGSAVLSEAGKSVLKELSNVLSQDGLEGRTISFEGHTDNVPIKGRLALLYPTNWELSLARAAVATRYVVEQGIDAQQIRAVGYGSSRPVSTNATERGRASNRRIEVHLVPELDIVRN